MSVRAVTNRQILLNITNMDDNQQELINDKTLGGANAGAVGGGGGGRSGGGVRDINGVKSVQVDPSNTTTTTTTLGLGAKMAEGSPSCGENGNNLNKFESGSGSGEHEGGTVEDGIDTAAKKRKTRRGKPKHRKLKPYSKQQISYEERLKSRGGITARRVVARKTGRQPPAPYNTTQFLMEDHSDLPDLEQKLAGAAAAGEAALPMFQKPTAPPRTRDSSFSIDSEDDYFYSSPEDEEEFLTKEFSTAYEDLHAERLSVLTKSELIQEYIQLESKVDLLTKRLRGKNFHQMEEKDVIINDNNKYSNINGNGTEIEIAKKLKICQQRIDDLIQQNEQLRRENDALKVQRRGGGGGGGGGSIASSIDSESDSDSTSDTSSCSCSGNSPIPAGIVASSNSQIFIRRAEQIPSIIKEQQKINGYNSDDETTTTTTTNVSHSRRFNPAADTSPKHINSNRNGNLISNGHANTTTTTTTTTTTNATQEINGLSTT